MKQNGPEVDCRGSTGATALTLVLAALEQQSEIWPEARTELGAVQPGWVTAETFFADSAAIAEYLDYEGSFRPGTDRKTCAAAMMVDYVHIFSIATVPLFVGHAIVPDLSPSLFALRFYTGLLEHDGETCEVRRAHVRYLPSAFDVVRQEGISSCDLYRRSTEAHFAPLVEKLHLTTNLSRNALWRLVADGIAARFLDVGKRFGVLEQAKISAMTILKQSGSPLNNRQLHYFDLTITDDRQREVSHTFRARGGCCRYYLVDDGEFCSTCVLNPPVKRDAELLLMMRRHVKLAATDSA